jgi:predicted unusual protein kinase regulating ubiquinone biosynthesis (AarF/ABC1/UbiB family)
VLGGPFGLLADASQVASGLPAWARWDAVSASSVLGVPVPPDMQGLVSALAPALAGVSAAIGFATFSLLFLTESTLSTPYPDGRYNARTAEAYFAERPGAQLFRTLDLMRLSLRFGLALFLDWRFKRIDANQPQRAQELTRLLTDCGATFIKIGQALSIRTDLLSPPYIEALSQLQDRVPAFSNDLAYATIRAELGLPAPLGKGGSPSDIPFVFSELSAKPVAAASLGQVYRARVRETGIEVAVKVQRPGVLEAIAIDMHLLRNAAALAKRLLPWLNTDLVGAVDEWGLRFVDELDYEMEAASALAFRRDVALTPLANVVCAPLPIPSLSSRRVLTAEWVSGVRLDSAPPAEIGKLCAVGLTSYLTMLLETGTLHCDPHPGNLLRTENGRLCILDWGLVTKVEGELQISFLEHIAHLTSRDFAAIPNDLVRLGFVPAGKEEAIAQAGVGEVLANLYMMLSGGGGANKIDVSEVARTLTGLTQTYGNIFQIPPYFLYILRAFTVLEGIGLQNDPDYSIVDACLPYITRRLVTDPSPRSRAALRSFVSSAAASGGARQIDARRAQQLVGGLSTYASATLGVNASGTSDEEDAISIATKLLLDERGNPLQSLLIDETARLADAVARDLASQIDAQLMRSGAAAVLDPLGAWAMMRQLLVKEAEDEEVLTMLRELLDTPAGATGTHAIAALPPSALGSALSPLSDAPPPTLRAALSNMDAELRTKLMRQAWEQRAGAATFGMRLAARMLLRASERLGRLSDPGVVDGQARDEMLIAIASVGKAATALSAAQLASQTAHHDDVDSSRVAT